MSVRRKAEEWHDKSAGWDPRAVTTRSVLDAFARTLQAFDDAQVRMGLPVLSLQDPRDIIGHVHGLSSQMTHVGPSMGSVEALGAQVLALALALARAEDSRLDLGGDAA
jgi:hypothetical protein